MHQPAFTQDGPPKLASRPPLHAHQPGGAQIDCSSRVRPHRSSAIRMNIVQQVADKPGPSEVDKQPAFLLFFFRVGVSLSAVVFVEVTSQALQYLPASEQQCAADERTTPLLSVYMVQRRNYLDYQNRNFPMWNGGTEYQSHTVLEAFSRSLPPQASIPCATRQQSRAPWKGVRGTRSCFRDPLTAQYVVYSGKYLFSCLFVITFALYSKQHPSASPWSQQQ